MGRGMKGGRKDGSKKKGTERREKWSTGQRGNRMGDVLLKRKTRQG